MVYLTRDHEDRVPVFSGESLLHGNLIKGPAIINREDTTILIEVNNKANVDMYGNLVIEVENAIS